MTSSAPASASRSPLRIVLLAVIAVGLVVLGGGAAVALGVGRATTPSADSVDAGFSWDMSRHHLQGVEMANLATDRSSDPLVRTLAFDIASTQTNQVGRMQGWLDLWGLPPTSDRAPMAWMGGMPHHGAGEMPGMAGMPVDTAAASTASGDGNLMPGMATQQELAHLRSLSGKAFDVEFLRLMIRHHEGGLPMAQAAAANAQEPAVRTLARSIAQTQSAETQTMLQMLTARGGTPLPAP